MTEPIEEYDYIVIGAGSAGCAVAGRLSENGRHTVLLLEAGGRDTNPWIHIPVGYGKTFGNAALTWQYSTEPSPGLNGRSLFTPSGRVLGGSSSINGLVYCRGQREDFDYWRDCGNPGWAYEDVLPYFRKTERQQHGANAFHGADGTLGVSDLADSNPLCRAFVESAVASGHPFNSDFNGARQDGFGYFQMTARNGRRNSSAVAFLSGAKRRSNLAIQTDSEVERLVLQDRLVSGVVYSRGDTRHQARARRSVVLCAGAINSPAILQRSGIGRPEWLQEAGIAVAHPLPGVGDQLHDHVQARLVLRSRRHPTLNTRIRNPLHMALMGLQYALLRKGPLASSGGQAGGFLRTSPGLNRPDVMVIFLPFSSTNYREGLDSFAGFTVSVLSMRPESRGTVRVRSAQRQDAPVIQPNYLSAEKDLQTLVHGLQAVRRIVSTDPLRQEIEMEERPGPDVHSNEAFAAYVRATAGSVFHPVGTCRMGPDAGAVVDVRLRVHGLAGLVVADASVMPSIVSGPTNAVSIMIGEKASALLLDEQ